MGALALLLAGVLVVAPHLSRILGNSGSSNETVNVEAPAAVAPSGIPDRLQIPAIGVDARVERVGRTPNGEMGVPEDPRDVAWYAPGVKPGGTGDAVIAGHLDWYTGRAVFWRLREVHVGDIVITLFTGGKRLQFRVSRTESYSVSREPSYLFGRGGQPTLSLITCAGAWDGAQYRDRLVVDAQLIT